MDKKGIEKIGVGIGASLLGFGLAHNMWKKDKQQKQSKRELRAKQKEMIDYILPIFDLLQEGKIRVSNAVLDWDNETMTYGIKEAISRLHPLNLYSYKFTVQKAHLFDNGYKVYVSYDVENDNTRVTVKYTNFDIYGMATFTLPNLEGYEFFISYVKNPEKTFKTHFPAIWKQLQTVGPKMIEEEKKEVEIYENKISSEKMKLQQTLEDVGFYDILQTRNKKLQEMLPEYIDLNDDFVEIIFNALSYHKSKVYILQDVVETFNEEILPTLQGKSPQKIVRKFLQYISYDNLVAQGVIFEEDGMNSFLRGLGEYGIRYPEEGQLTQEWEYFDEMNIILLFLFLENYATLAS